MGSEGQQGDDFLTERAIGEEKRWQRERIAGESEPWASVAAYGRIHVGEGAQAPEGRAPILGGLEEIMKCRGSESCRCVVAGPDDTRDTVDRPSSQWEAHRSAGSWVSTRSRVRDAGPRERPWPEPTPLSAATERESRSTES